jgi:hypothetical protein
MHDILRKSLRYRKTNRNKIYTQGQHKVKQNIPQVVIDPVISSAEEEGNDDHGKIAGKVRPGCPGISVSRDKYYIQYYRYQCTGKSDQSPKTCFIFKLLPNGEIIEDPQQ